MSGRIRAHIRSNVVGYIALFVALSGTAWAANTVGSADVVNNSLQSVDLKDNAAVRSRDVVDDAVTGGGLKASDLRPNSVGGSEVQDNALTGADVDESGLTAGGDLAGSVADAQLGADVVGTNEVANDSLTGNDIAESSLGQVLQATNAGTLDGLDSSAFAGSGIYELQNTTDGSANVNGTCPSGDLCYAGGSYCDNGDTMVGGGFGDIDNGTRLVASEPFTPNPQDTWRVKFVNNSTEDTITVDTICADNGAPHA